MWSLKVRVSTIMHLCIASFQRIFSTNVNSNSNVPCVLAVAARWNHIKIMLHLTMWSLDFICD